QRNTGSWPTSINSFPWSERSSAARRICRLAIGRAVRRASPRLPSCSRHSRYHPSAAGGSVARRRAPAVRRAGSCRTNLGRRGSAFGAREDLVGQSIEIDGAGHEVIGIMPSGFDLLDKRIQLWLPLQLAPTTRQFRSSHFLSVVGRLKNGVGQEQAQTELASL